jgi:hypothetical protein
VRSAASSTQGFPLVPHSFFLPHCIDKLNKGELMNWLKNWIVSLLGPKFLKDKIAHLLTLLNGLLVTEGIATVQQAQSFQEAIQPILLNVAMLAVSLILSIGATKKAAEE